MDKDPSAARRLTDALVWGGLLITVGLVLLLNSLGVVSWDLWGVMWRFWPLFLILWGLSLFMGRSRWGAVVVGLIAILMMLGAVGYSILATRSPNWMSGNFWMNMFNSNINWNWEWSPTETVTETITVAEADHQGVQSRVLQMQVDSGFFTVTDSDATNYLFVDATYTKDQGKPIVRDTLSAGKLNLGFSTENSTGWFMGNIRRDYKLELGQPNLATEIKLDLGSGSGGFDLNEVKLSALDVEISSGSLDIALGTKSIPTTKGDIQVSSGNMEIVLPEDLGIRVDFDISSGNATIDGRFYTDDGTYESINYDSADQQWDIQMRVSSGNVTIRRSSADV